MLEGLAAEQSWLPSKLFYDDQGSKLFEAICDLDEYYPTRTELSILETCRADVAELTGGKLTLVEYGSGSTRKVRLLLDGLDIAAYVPIDISRWYLEEAAKDLHGSHPDLLVRPVLADFNQDIRLPDGLPDGSRVAFFPGGTIGNLRPDDAVAFLRRARKTLGSGGYLLVGYDLRKDPVRLHAAYNDRDGVTAAFNRNVLLRINRELDGDFDPSTWHHYAPYVPARGRIEMHLVSGRDQKVTVAGETFEFTRGDSIRTELSHKYSRAGFDAIANDGGYEPVHHWTDEESLFCVSLLRVLE